MGSFEFSQKLEGPIKIFLNYLSLSETNEKLNDLKLSENLQQDRIHFYL